VAIVLFVLVILLAVALVGLFVQIQSLQGTVIGLQSMVQFLASRVGR